MRSRNLIVLLLYSLLAIALTWPLAAQFGTHVPGTETWSLDEYGYLWNHWWFKFSLFDHGWNPFSTDYLFYPIGTSLVLYAYTLLHVALALPLHFTLGLVTASNATVLFSFIVSAFGMYLFASYLLRVSFRVWDARTIPAGPGPDLRLIPAAAFLAGLAFAFTSNRFVYLSLGHYNVVATEWIPFYLLFLIKTLLNRGLRFPILAGLYAALALYSETTDGVLLLLLTAVVLVFEWRLLRQPGTLARTAGIAAAAAVFFSPLLLPTLNELLNSGYALPGWGHSEKLLVDLQGFFSPTSLHPLNRFWVQELDRVRQGNSRFSDVNTYFVGFATALLALVGALRYFRNVKLWIATALGFAILALGPLLHIGGVSEFDLDNLTVTFPLPFLALHYIPIIRENRVPNRYSLLVVFALAILIAYGAYWLFSRLPRMRRLAIFAPTVLASLLIFEHLPLPLPLTDARIPAVYSQIGSEPGDFSVLTLPLGWRNSFGQLGAEDTRTQFYQSAAGKHWLTGQIQRNPPSLMTYFQNLPVLHSIIELETYHDLPEGQFAVDRAAAAALVYFLDLRYVVINRAVPNRPPFSDTRDRTLDFVTQVLPLAEKIYDKDGVIAWRLVSPIAPQTIQIDMGSSAAAMFQASGWSAPDRVADTDASWLTARPARLLLPIRALGDHAITLRALPFLFPNSPPQRLTPLLNGQPLAAVELQPGWQEYLIVLPGTLLHPGLNELTLDPAYLARPHDVLPPNFKIGVTGVSSPVDLLVQSSSDFGSIKVSAKEISPLKRGYNLAIIDPGSGKLLDVKNFDTGGSIVESRALTDFVGKLPNGVIVAGAVQEDASANLGDRAVAALTSLGLETSVRGHPGASHAFVGVKGAAPGTVLEVSNLGQGASLVSVGHAADDRPLGVAVQWLRIEKR